MRYLQWRVLAAFALAVIVIAACQGPPPTMFVLVVTATPGAEVAVSPSAAVVRNTPPSTPIPKQPRTPALTPTIDPFPTTTVNQIQVAEQRFEHGRMFWLQPTGQIWVLAYADPGGTRGTWTVYTDTFQDGQPEFDPNIVAPDNLYQPERGFGKLWRTNPEVRDALGWALETEFGHPTQYEYHAGGTVNAQGKYVAGPGYHILNSLWGEWYRFKESDGTWVVQ